MIKYAIATEGDTVSSHFGRCPEFTLVELEEGTIGQISILANPGHQPDFLPRFLKDRGVHVVVAGGMGSRAVSLLQANSIQVCTGIQGTIEQVCTQIVAGTLTGTESACRPGEGKGYGIPKTSCDHHDEDHT